ncbi:MAG TPA: hypothetical protein VEC06_04670 [Paucimonas sp.]|nr:hypothetical protein [Paucimonas sp.]
MKTSRLLPAFALALALAAPAIAAPEAPHDKTSAVVVITAKRLGAAEKLKMSLSDVGQRAKSLFAGALTLKS